MPVTNGEQHLEWLQRVREAVRRTDSRAFLVPARIVRRVIKQDRDVPGIGLHVPHRKSYVLSGTRIGHFVEKDELGLTVAEDYPPHVFLLAEPKESELEGMSESALRLWAWRLLFHTRIHFEFERKLVDDQLRPAEIRAAIDRLGQVEFDEAESVLRREHFLIGRPSRTEVFIEFAAVYWEYRFFAPHRLPWYFPSLPAFSRVDAILSEHLDVFPLLEETKPKGEWPPAEDVATLTGSRGRDESQEAPHSGRSRCVGGETETTAAVPGFDGRDGPQETNEAVLPEKGLTAAGPASSEEGRPLGEADLAAGGPAHPRRFHRLMRSAERNAARGNMARAAVLSARAFVYGMTEQRIEAAQKVREQVQLFSRRLVAALHIPETTAASWQEVLGELVKSARDGFWNSDRKLLYDLNNVCLTHERTIYRIDLIGWLRSRGKKPIKRPLAFQREVLLVKNLRTALRRLPASRVSHRIREMLSHLLHQAMQRAEERLREMLRPVLRDVLQEEGLSPGNLPEEVAFAKLIEEILDELVERGFINMAVLRDAISRNRLKLEDLEGREEFLRGDELLRANRRLADELEGIYRGGEFYLRWLQRISSLAFGTRWGRAVVLFGLIPFGGSYLVLTFLAHLAAKTGADVSLLTDWKVIALGGLFLVGMIHGPTFRRGVGFLMSWLMQLLAAVLIDLPLWAVRNPVLRQFLRSPPVVLARRFLVTPTVLTLFFCLALPRLGLYAEPEPLGMIAVFVLLTAVLNSRLGRDFEELSADWVEHTWYQIRTRVFVALFEWVMAVFKTMLDVVERYLYAVDEWLRFHSGQSPLTFVVKAVFGVFWSVVTFAVTFCVTLLLEPQINPIKHFPVVTVSHKIILPMEPMIQRSLEGPLGQGPAHLVAFAIVTSLPGIFGFLVWELRANWRLYAANREKLLQPVPVGHHGETITRLLKPGFHSGTLPRLFAKIRREVRRLYRHREPAPLNGPGFSSPEKENGPPETLRNPLWPEQSAAAWEAGQSSSSAEKNEERAGAQAEDSDDSPDKPQMLTELFPELPSAAGRKLSAALQHLAGAVRRFIEREFTTLLEIAEVASPGSLRVVRVFTACNSMRVTLSGNSGDSDEKRLTLVFQEQSGRLVAGLLHSDWLRGQKHETQQVVGMALAGLYHFSGADLVREQIAVHLGTPPLRYDIAERNLVVWPEPRFEMEILYDLDDRPVLRPFPAAEAEKFGLGEIPANRFFFAEQPVSWDDWVAFWTTVQQQKRPPETVPLQAGDVLPPLPEDGK